MHLARGAERMRLRFQEVEHETLLVVVLEQAQVVRYVAAGAREVMATSSGM